MKTQFFSLALGLLVSLMLAGNVRAQAFSPEQLQQRAIERRAVEAVIWGMPAVNYDLMLQEMLTKTPSKVNEVFYWGKPLDWHNQTLTPNPDTLYFMTFLNTKDVGPLVIEVPPAGEDGSLNANIVNVWQVPLEDAGLLGLDKGAGLKLLMLPPDYKEKAPEGYTVLQPGTWGSYALFRSNLKSHGEVDVAKSAAYAKRVKVYPLSQAAAPPETKFTDVQVVDFDSTIRYDATFFEHLNRIVQAEPWLSRDGVMIDHLKTLGIEKGSRSRRRRKPGRGIQLGADRPATEVRADVPRLRPDEGVLREDVEAAGCGGSEVKQTTMTMSTKILNLALLAMAAVVPVFAEGGERVTADNFKRAETDTYFSKFVSQGALGELKHEREMASIDHQTVIRTNRDTLYSFGVFDLDAGPVSLTLPDPGKRYMAVLLIDEDHYNPDVYYAPGKFTITKEEVGTRYVCMAVRTFANPNDPADMKAAHALQDGIKAEQKSAGSFEVPKWDVESLKKVREALLALTDASGGIDSARMFGRKDQVDPVSHLMGTAAGWGGNPRAAAIYTASMPAKNDGKTPYAITFKDVPVDAFWSISVYNKGGFFEKNAKDAYVFNSATAKPNADGSYTIRFGGDESASNYLPITPGWNYLVRMYRPRKEILDGNWKFPEAQPAN